MISQKNKAFTLVELIVVIVILAILATIAFLSFQNYSGQARDSNRMADINGISKGIELYFVKTGVYPVPDNSFTITYSGGGVWYQGTIGDNLVRKLGNLSKKAIDPLTSSEYIYSTLVYGSSYQIKSNYEGDSLSYNIPHLTSPNPGEEPSSLPLDKEELEGVFGFNKTQASTGNPRLAYIKGNYMGVVSKTTTGSTICILAIPSIITNTGSSGNSYEIGNNSLSGTLLYHGQSNTNGIYYNPNKPIYCNTSLPTNDTNSGLTNIASGIINAYSGSIVTSLNTSVQTIVNTPSSSLSSLGASIVSGQLGGSVVASVNNTQVPTITGLWPSIDPNCTKSDVVVGSQVWAGCNSTIGSIAQNYNNGTCYNYSYVNAGGSNCYGITTQENRTGISTTASGYSGIIGGISTNIYGAMYIRNNLSSNGCLGTGIPSSNTTCPCKGGYHIPTQAEFDALENSLGCNGSEKITADLPQNFECNTSNFNDTTNGLGWTSNNPNSLRNKLGLTLAGFCDGGTCANRGVDTYYWTTGIYASDTSKVWQRYLISNNAAVGRWAYTKQYAFSVRCIKD